MSKPQSHQIVNEDVLPVLRTTAREQLNSILSKVDADFDIPLRLRAANPSDATLVIGSSQINSSDGSKKVAASVNEVVGNFPQTTVNFQTAAVVGGTVTVVGNTFALPTTTVGEFRRVAFVYQADLERVDCVFSDAAASVGALTNPGSLFSALDGLPIGYVDLEATASNAFKTAGSATDIIENVVSGTARIFRFGSGAGGGGAGDASSLVARLENEFLDAPYNYLTPVAFITDRGDFVDPASTGAYQSKGFVFGSASDTLVSTQLLDEEFLNDTKTLEEVRLTVVWRTGKVDAAAVYEVSRDDGEEYQTIEMNRVGDTNTYEGVHTFEPETAEQAVYSQPTVSTTKALNATTQQSIGQAFTLAEAAVVKSVDLDVTKTGSPTGYLYVSIRPDDSSLPETKALSESRRVDISSISTGTVSVAIPAVHLPAGTYHVVVRTDATYKSVFNAGVTQLALDSNTTTDGLSVFNGTAWSDSGSDGLRIVVNGSILALRLKVTSSAGDKVIDGFGVFYDRVYTGVVPGFKMLERAPTFLSATDNEDTFTITKFAPDADMLRVYDVEAGQVYRYPAFQINGQDVVFPADTFYDVADRNVTLLFDQTATPFDGASDNANRISTLESRLDWSTVSTTYTAIAGDRLFANSSGGIFTITLPANPQFGDEIHFADPTDSWATNVVTVARNGKNINGVAADLTLNVAGAYARLIYFNVAQGWRVY